MRFCVLGPLQVLDHDGTAVAVPGSKLRTVLTMLVMRAGEGVTTDQLSDALWGDQPPASAHNALQTHISKLRRLLEPDMLDTQNGSYVLRLGGSSVDAVDFLTLAASGRELLSSGRAGDAVTVLRQALALWRGDALIDLDEVEFAVPDRVRLRESRISAREDLLDAELGDGEADAVVAVAEALLSEHPLRERMWATLMVALYRSGRQADALRSFQRARAVLGEELGLEPGPVLRDLEQRILAHDPSLLPAARVTEGGARLTNMYPALSQFVGRAEELLAISNAINMRRLVTLTGPGGVGKTRLATEVGLASAALWPDGTWFVDLGVESGVGAADRAFRRTFGQRLGHGDGSTLDWLAAGLATARLLIVLDNCEHVLTESAPLIEALLRLCGNVHVLATSRQPLGCEGELVREVRPLPMDEAVELFRARAEDSSATIDRDEVTSDAVHAICDHVDRLPLAIELTAARARVFSVPQLADMLGKHSTVASTDSAARPRRQQTLEFAVGWSYELLFEDERRLLARLSVFAGGFTLDAVTHVCSDDVLPVEEIGMRLARLVDKSLVASASRDGHPAPRFQLLRPVAEFAEARLEEAGETLQMRARHAAWLVDLTGPVTQEMRGHDALTWATLVRAEMANLARAAHWVLDGGDTRAGLVIATNLGWYAFLSANIHEDHPGLVAMLGQATGCEPELMCRARALAGLLSIGYTGRRTWAMDAVDVARTASGRAWSGSSMDHDMSIDTTRAAIEIARGLGDEQLLMDVLAFGGLHLAAVAQSPDAVQELAAELRSIASARGDRWHVALAAGLDGLAAYVRGDLAAAVVAYGSSIQGLRLLGDAGTAAVFEVSASEAVEFLGDLSGAISHVTAAYEYSAAAGFRSAAILRAVLCWLTGRNGEVQRALELGRQGLDAVRRPFNPVIRAQALFALGSAELLAGLLQPAEEHVSEALSIHARVGMVREAAMDHRALGDIAGARGDRAEARRRHSSAVELAVCVGLEWTIMLTVSSLSQFVADDDVPTACALVGIADRIRHDKGYVDTVDDDRRRTEVLRRCTDRAGADAVATARRRGAAISFDLIPELIGC